MIRQKVWSRSSRHSLPSGQQRLSALNAPYYSRSARGRFLGVVVASLAFSYLFFRGIGSTVGSDEYSLVTMRNETAPTTATLMAQRTGVIVLGMHRSGTSMLTGLLALGTGYATGDNLMPAKRNNPKGFFERQDALFQNMAFLEAQKIPDTSAPHIRAYQTGNSNITLSAHGQSAVEFFNNNTNIPWIQKDPRMCITLHEWLPFLKTEPAILLTYRHPLEVARSMNNRKKRTLASGLDVWVAYNQAAIRNSAGLCRVVTSNDKILQNPVEEVSRIVQELTSKCGVLPPPHVTPSMSVVEGFVDVRLQRSKIENLPGCNDTSAVDAEAVGLRSELELRRLEQAMKLYCDLQSGRSFMNDPMV